MTKCKALAGSAVKGVSRILLFKYSSWKCRHYSRRITLNGVLIYFLQLCNTLHSNSLQWMVILLKQIRNSFTEFIKISFPHFCCAAKEWYGHVRNYETLVLYRNKYRPMPILLYGLNVYVLTNRNIQSLDFTLNRVLIKLCWTSSVKYMNVEITLALSYQI